MEFGIILAKMIQLFLMIIVGYIACKCKILGKEARQMLSALILNVTLPAVIISSVSDPSILPETPVILGSLLLAFGLYFFYYVAAFIFTALFGSTKAHRLLYINMLVFGNVAFMGYPVIQSIFGLESTFYIAIFNIPFSVLTYSLGAAMVSRSADLNSGRSAGGEKMSLRKILLTPSLIASLLSIIAAVFRIGVPSIIGDTASVMGGITTPAALMIIGSSLAEISIGEVFTEFRLYLIVILKLIVLPLMVFFMLSPFISNAILLGVSVMTTAMPIATTGVMLCLQYGADEKLMAKSIFLTTLASVVTIPVLSALLF